MKKIWIVYLIWNSDFPNAHVLGGDTPYIGVLRMIAVFFRGWNRNFEFFKWSREKFVEIFGKISKICIFKVIFAY